MKPLGNISIALEFLTRQLILIHELETTLLNNHNSTVAFSELKEHNDIFSIELRRHGPRD